jgi:hypothetical protein
MTADGQIPPELPTHSLWQPRLTPVSSPRTEHAGVRAPFVHALVVRAEIVILVATLVTGLGAWGVGVRSVGYDYDEVRYAHSVWLTAQGLRPYHDFLDCHPPYFALLSPIFRIYPNDPSTALWTLRLVGAIGNLLFLGGLAALGARSLPSARHWAFIAVAVIAFQPAILQFLVEFRIDGWGYALAVWSIYRYRRLGRGTYRGFELIVLTGIASFLLCPKLALLPPLVIGFDAVLGWDSVRSGVRSAMAYLVGTIVAIGLFAVYLTWHGIEFGRTFQSVVSYNAISNANLGLRYGLLRSIIAQKALSLAIAGGVISAVAYGCRVRSLPDGYDSALAVWLVLQALLVAYPYKQYYAPWFLFASGFLVYLGRDMANLLRIARVMVLLTVCGMTVVADWKLAERWSDLTLAQKDQSLIKWMNRVTRPGDRVVAAPPLHPIDRFDSFFVWFNTLDRSGFDSERILEQLPVYKKSVTLERFREELEDHPPALVVLSGDWRIVPYTGGQREALADLVRKGGYVAVTVGKARFALRPDRFQAAKRDGLLEAVGRRLTGLPWLVTHP